MFAYPRQAIAIRHPTASGTYQKVKDADAAVQAFVAAWAEEMEKEDQGS